MNRETFLDYIKKIYANLQWRLLIYFKNLHLIIAIGSECFPKGGSELLLLLLIVPFQINTHSLTCLIQNGQNFIGVLAFKECNRAKQVCIPENTE